MVNPLAASRSRDRAWDVAARVTDPEMPMLTLADLGVLRDVRITEHDGREVLDVTITPTYSGCPAMAAMRDDLVRVLRAQGWAEINVEVRLSPAWSSDWISEEGRVALRESGISPPSTVVPDAGPIPIRLLPTRRSLHCPRCDSPATVIVSEFGPTACKAVYRCTDCLETFEHVKEI